MADALLDETQDLPARSRSRHKSPQRFDLNLSDSGAHGLQGLVVPPSALRSVETNPTKVPKAIQKHINDASRNFRQNLDYFAAANSSLAKHNRQHTFFAENKDGYPDGCKPFKLPGNMSEMDEQWSFTKDGPNSLTIQFEGGISRASAGAILHRFWTKTWKSIEVEAGESRVAALAPLVRPQKLLDAVLESVNEGKEPDLAERLGCFKPFSDTPDDIITQATWDKYRALYSDFERTLKRRAAQAEASKAQSSSIDAEIQKANPMDLFAQAVAIGVKRELAAHGFSDPLVDEEMGTASAASEFVNAIQKNEKSPVTEAGQNVSFVKPTPKAKPRAKQASKPGARETQSKVSGGKRGKNGPRSGNP